MFRISRPLYIGVGLSMKLVLTKTCQFWEVVVEEEEVQLCVSLCVYVLIT